MHLVVRDCVVISFFFFLCHWRGPAGIAICVSEISIQCKCQVESIQVFDAGVRILPPYSIPHTGSYVLRGGGDEWRQNDCVISFHCCFPSIQISNNKTNTEFNMMVRVMFHNLQHERTIHLWAKQLHHIIIAAQLVNWIFGVLHAQTCVHGINVVRVPCWTQCGWKSQFYSSFQSFFIHKELPLKWWREIETVRYASHFLCSPPYDPMSTVRNVLAAVDVDTTNFGKSAKIKYVKMSSNRFDSDAINDTSSERTRHWYIFHFSHKIQFMRRINLISIENDSIQCQSNFGGKKTEWERDVRVATVKYYLLRFGHVVCGSSFIIIIAGIQRVQQQPRRLYIVILIPFRDDENSSKPCHIITAHLFCIRITDNGPAEVQPHIVSRDSHFGPIDDGEPQKPINFIFIFFFSFLLLSFPMMSILWI